MGNTSGKPSLVYKCFNFLQCPKKTFLDNSSGNRQGGLKCREHIPVGWNMLGFHDGKMAITYEYIKSFIVTLIYFYIEIFVHIWITATINVWKCGIHIWEANVRCCGSTCSKF